MSIAWLKQLPVGPITQLIPVSGGDVNQAYRVITPTKHYFLLTQAHRDADFYAGEIAGLEAFQAAGITAPQVIASGSIANTAYLLLSYLEGGGQEDQYALGELVARLHQTSAPNGLFGFDYPYRGSAITFTNHWQKTWVDLFVGERLDTLSARLTREHLWQPADQTRYQQVRQQIVTALTAHHSQPVLLHGDLWFGNVMFLADGKPALFDPSPLYGDREFDLGITRTFGGFTADFYRGYEHILPTSHHSRYRQEFYRLYLLMIHLLKFQGSYYAAVHHALTRLSQWPTPER